MISVARGILKKTKLCVHSIPGISTIKNNIQPAIDLGVDIFRVASHCTEATITKTHIEHLKTNNKTVYGVLMMSALADEFTLLKEATKMYSYGADAIIIMDSTGTYLPFEVTSRIKLLKDNLPIEIGFHGHNNLNMAVINSIMAANSGATIIDACIRGFGAGAGNAPLELILPILEKTGYTTGISFEETIKEADRVMDYLVPSAPITTPINVLTGLTRLFSGFEKPIIKASKLYGIEYSSLIFELGNRKLVAGQEDLILEVAQKLKESK
jgi:4-hydroxy 2-oxovalerate aldolase